MAASAFPAFARDFDFKDHDNDDFNKFHFKDHDDDFDFDNFRGFGNFDLDNDNESESGDFSADFSVRNTGDYASQCVPAIQFGNTGNFNNSPSFAQFGSLSGDFEPGGIEFAFEPELAVDCSHTVQQSSAANSSGYRYGW